jgi:signal transduction histidine kinase
LSGLLQLLADTPLEERQRQWLHRARECSGALLGLMTDVLDLARLQRGELQAERTGFAPRETLQQALLPLLAVAADRQVQLQWHFADHLPAQVVGDPLRTRQILFNLAANAVRFTTGAEVRVDISIAPMASGLPGLHIQVADCGPGMDGEQLKQAFQPFTQLDGSLTRRQGGAGLGLPLVEQLVRLLDGELSVDSTPGRGSQFRVGVPLHG